MVNAVVCLCRSPKSRITDDLLNVVYTEREAEGKCLPIPDFALDMHTRRGREKGRGIDYFFSEGNKLSNEAFANPYTERAKELLVIEADPMTNLHVGHIRVDASDTASKPYVNVRLDGKQYLKDFLMVDSNLHIDFGKNLLLNCTKKPIVIEMKKTAAGTGDLIATAFADGIETARTVEV